MSNKNKKVRVVDRDMYDMPETGVIHLATLYYQNIYYGFFCSRKAIDRLYFNSYIIKDDGEDISARLKREITPTVAVTDSATEKELMRCVKKRKLYDVSSIKVYIKSSKNWIGKNIIPKMVSTNVDYVNGTNCVIAAICRLDDQHYAAIYDFVLNRGHVEYVWVRSTGGNTLSFRPVYNDTEWSIITNFFNDRNVFELASLQDGGLGDVMRLWQWQRINGKDIIPEAWMRNIEKKRYKKRIK